MYMVKKLDAGNIISQKAINIEEDDNVGTMHDKLSFLGADLLKDTLPSIVNETNDSIPQDDSEATFASNISREDERINWNQSAQDIHNHIRGLSPWPVAYTTMDDKILNYIHLTLSQVRMVILVKSLKRLKSYHYWNRF